MNNDASNDVSNESKTTDAPVSRRQFVVGTAASAAALATGLQGISAASYAGASDEIRIGLVGCGGRGTGAVMDAVKSSEGVKLVAMADLFQDKLDESRERLEKLEDAFAVEDSATHVGFESYRNVLDDENVNYVILATPPGFRPVQFRETMEAGKHCFFEKPVAVDPPGIRSILESGRIADEKNLKVVTGTIYRRAENFVEGIELLKGGELGKPTAGYTYYMSGPGWTREVDEDASEMERQCRNWLHYPWLAGDHIVEQSVHNIDVLHWLLGPAKSALATGGKIASRDESIWGPSYDHFSVEYEFDPGIRVQFTSRKIAGVENRVANRIIYEKGVADLNPGVTNIVTHDGKVVLRTKSNDNAYVTEHRDLIAAIREDKALNETKQIAESTLMAIIGRESAYSGDKVEFDWALEDSEQDLGPDEWSFGDAPSMETPIPGEYKLT